MYPNLLFYSTHVITVFCIRPFYYDPRRIYIKNRNYLLGWLTHRWTTVLNANNEWCALEGVVRFVEPMNICKHTGVVDTHVFEKTLYHTISWVSIDYTCYDRSTRPVPAPTNTLARSEAHTANIALRKCNYTSSDGVYRTTWTSSCCMWPSWVFETKIKIVVVVLKNTRT